MNVRLRHLAFVNPPVGEFEQLSLDADVTFLPLEAVWADSRLDTSRVRRKSEVSVGYTRFRNGDIVVPKVAPTFQAGRAAIVADLVNEVGAGTTELHVLRARPGTDARFLRYVALSKLFLTMGVSAFQGVAGLQRVSDDFVRDFPVAELSLEEQRRISDFLDDVNAKSSQLVVFRRRQAKLLQERLEAELVGRLVLGPGEGARRTRLKYLFEFERNGLWGDEPIGDRSDRICVRVADFNRHRFVSSDSAETVRSVEPRQAARHCLRPGDVLLEKSGGGDNSPVGFAVSYQGPPGAICSNFVAQLRPNSSCDPRYVGLLMAALYVGRRNVPYIKQATGIQNLDSAAYLGQAVALPDRPRQELVACELDEMIQATAALSARIKKSVTLIAERMQSLVSEAVSGALDVSTLGRLHGCAS